MRQKQVMIVTVAYNSMTEAERAQFKSEMTALGDTVVFLPYNPVAGSAPDVVHYFIESPEPSA